MMFSFSMVRGIPVKTILSTILLPTCSWSPVVGQTPINAATKDDVQQFMSVLNIRQQMSLVINGMMQQLTNGMIDQFKRSGFYESLIS
jgi:hypothetical protein